MTDSPWCASLSPPAQTLSVYTIACWWKGVAFKWLLVSDSPFPREEQRKQRVPMNCKKKTWLD